MFCLGFAFYFFYFLFWGGYKGERQMWKDWEKSEIGVHDVKFQKNQI